MFKLQKKHFIAGGIMIFSVSAAFLYLQFQKIKEYCIGVTKISIVKFTWTSADIDLFLKFVNRSKFKITLFSQQYNVYINNKPVLKVSNSTTQIILPQAPSPLSVKLQFSPKDILATLKMNSTDLITSPDKINIKISALLTAGIGFLKFDIPYDYNTTLKEMMTSSEPNSSSTKC